MTCRSCSARIDDRAIVCYKCGAPTAVPSSRRPAPQAQPQVWPWAALVLVIVLLVALYFLINPTPTEAPVVPVGLVLL